MSRSRFGWCVCAVAVGPWLGACHRPPAPAHVVATATNFEAGSPVLAISQLVEVSIPAEEVADTYPVSAMDELVGRRARIHLDEHTVLRPELLGGEELAHPAASVHERGRLVSASLRGAETLHSNDFIDILGSFTDPDTQELFTMTLLQKVRVLGVPQASPGTNRVVDLEVLPEEVEVLREAERLGVLQASQRNPDDLDFEEDRRRVSSATLVTAERLNQLLRKRLNAITPHDANTHTPHDANTYGGAPRRSTHQVPSPHRRNRR